MAFWSFMSLQSPRHWLCIPDAPLGTCWRAEQARSMMTRLAQDSALPAPGGSPRAGQAGLGGSRTISNWDPAQSHRVSPKRPLSVFGPRVPVRASNQYQRATSCQQSVSVSGCVS